MYILWDERLLHARTIHKASTYIHSWSNFFVGSIESQSFMSHQALWFSMNGVIAGHQALWFLVFHRLFSDPWLLAVRTCCLLSPIASGNSHGHIFHSRLCLIILLVIELIVRINKQKKQPFSNSVFSGANPRNRLLKRRPSILIVH